MSEQLRHILSMHSAKDGCVFCDWVLRPAWIFCAAQLVFLIGYVGWEHLR